MSETASAGARSAQTCSSTAREDSVITSLDEIAPGTRVATSFPKITRDFFDARSQNVEIVPISGAAEIAPLLGIAEVIVDITSTGSTLRVNGLREIGLLLTSRAQLVTKCDTVFEQAKAEALESLIMALDSVVRARGKRYLMANVQRSSLDAVKKIIPGINGPTVIDILNGGDRVAVHAVVDADRVYKTISALKALDATRFSSREWRRLTAMSRATERTWAQAPCRSGSAERRRDPRRALSPRTQRVANTRSRAQDNRECQLHGCATDGGIIRP